jgi:monofunctional biosynthetic peptidoglycan transglycosylase
MSLKSAFSTLFNFTLFILSGAALLGVALALVIVSLPDVTDLEKCFTTSMYGVKLCPGSGQYVTIRNISPYAIHAVIAAEDGSFYSHKGFDWHEMKESLNANLTAGKVRRGGSTLTQQLAKNAFLDKEKSLWRKVKEAYLAYKIEQHYKKDFILEKYLNVVEFGPGLYGIRAASSHYFHKSPAELNPLESAYLASLLPNPKVYSRSFAKGSLTKFGRKMVLVILRRMVAFGKLSKEGYDIAANSVDAFPWTGMSIASFQGGAHETSSNMDRIFEVEKGALDRLIEEETDQVDQEVPEFDEESDPAQ